MKLKVQLSKQVHKHAAKHGLSLPPRTGEHWIATAIAKWIEKNRNNQDIKLPGGRNYKLITTELNGEVQKDLVREVARRKRWLGESEQHVQRRIIEAAILEFRPNEQ